MNNRPLDDPQCSEHEDLTVEEELVAYLDGELDGAAAILVERRISEDREYRQQLQKLQHAWELLDALPTSEVSEDFTQSTVDMVVVSAQQAAEEAGLLAPRKHLLRKMLFGATLCLGCLLGYLLLMFYFESDNRHLVKDLEVIENMDIYTHVGSMQFLKALQGVGYFSRDEVASGTGSQATPLVNDLELRINQMNASDKQQMQSQCDRFLALEETQRQALRQLQSQLEKDEDVAHLKDVVERYSDWLKVLPANERYELLSLDGKARLERVRELIASQEQQTIEYAGRLQLARDDVPVLVRWLTEILRRDEVEILAKLPPKARKRFEQMTGLEMQRRSFLLRAMVQADSRFKEQDIRRLVEKVSSKTRLLLEKAESKGLEARQKVLKEWVLKVVDGRQQAYVTRLRRSVGPKELQRFVKDELTLEQRRTLENLSQNEIKKRILRWYWQAYGGKMATPLREPVRKPRDDRPAIVQ